MSFCSSPASQRSSFSSAYSADYASPNTAVTTPSSSGAISPKVGQSYAAYTQPPSPDAHDLSYQYNPASPFSTSEYMNDYTYAYSYNHLAPPSPFTYTPQPAPLSPNASYAYPGRYANVPESPLPSSHHSPQSPTPGAVTPPRKYSGYPPASAFYGPLPNSPTASSSSSSSSRYRRKQSRPINPEEYKPESWYTADGQKVEYSAMHLQCATM